MTTTVFRPNPAPTAASFEAPELPPQLFRVLGTFVAMSGGDTDLELVGALADALLETPSSTLMAEQLRRDPACAALIEARWIPPAHDLEQLAALPECSLGQAYAASLARLGYDPNLHAGMEPGSDAAYVVLRLSQTHDLWHVLTGFDTTVTGEIGLQAFHLTQFPYPLGAVLTAQALLSATLAPLPSAQAEQEGDTDAVARRFDLLLYNLQLSLLRSESRFLRLQKQVRQLASLLEQKHSIPMVAAELELIQDLLHDEWWQDVTLPMLEEVRRRLRGLVGLIETEAQDPLYTDFSDEIVAIKEVDGAALLTRDEFRQFRLRAQNFLKQHEDHLTMQLCGATSPSPPPTWRNWSTS
jgi:ubiquinone biosynthesis protein COQ4